MTGESQQVPSGGEPDPSVLTTEQMLREVNNLKDWTRDLIAAGKDVTEEKFKSVDTQVGMAERYRVEQKKDTKDAVDAALSAAKEAVQEQTKASGEAIGKSEAQFIAAQQQMATQFDAGIKAMGEKFDDLKDRVVRIETIKVTENHSNDQQRMDFGVLISLAGVCIAIISVVVVVLMTTR